MLLLRSFASRGVIIGCCRVERNCQHIDASANSDLNAHSKAASNANGSAFRPFAADGSRAR